MRYGFIAAIEAEARAFPAARGALRAGGEFVVQVCGPGNANAERTARELVAAGCDVLVSWGVAGGLDPRLRCGTLVAAQACVDEAGRRLTFDAGPLEHLLGRLNDPAPERGQVLTVTRALDSARAKDTMHRHSGAAVVDMESIAIAAVAQSAGRGYCGLRAVLDDAAFELPHAALGGLGSDGRMRPLATAAAVLAGPRQLPRLLRLALHFRTALGRLTHTARALAGAET